MKAIKSGGQNPHHLFRRRNASLINAAHRVYGNSRKVGLRRLAYLRVNELKAFLDGALRSPTASIVVIISTFVPPPPPHWIHHWPWAHRWVNILMSETYGQCDARSTVTFPSLRCTLHPPTKRWSGWVDLPGWQHGEMVAHPGTSRPGSM